MPLPIRLQRYCDPASLVCRIKHICALLVLLMSIILFSVMVLVIVILIAIVIASFPTFFRDSKKRKKKVDKN